ncbi:TlpA family protein disulfide reductase [Parabacteroides sp. FAFU027]|uniref:TlpA family protein disulfide reductase n=1 Tax=Parabacteroides sp. FAFU027 TaxID=2922715 RepID=UPI001FAEEEBE|nr:TlpA disulfide reductase family protein [Parabacteroides sp. FAFU027]
MKKHILLVLLLTLLGQAGIAQNRVIKSPRVEAATHTNVIIDRIALSDTATVLDFTVSNYPGQWIIFAKKNYLINSDGGNKIYCKYAIGYNGQLGDKWYMPESGKVHFSLVYPPIDKKLSKIDFIEGDNIDGAFKIFGVEINPSKRKALLPEALEGNWLKTDGSNEWTLGMYEKAIVYQNKLWDKFYLKKEGGVYVLHIGAEKQSHRLYIKALANGDIKVGKDMNKLEVLSKCKTENKAFKYQNNAGYTSSFFHRDSAIVKGFVYGYHPKISKTGMAYVNDIFTGKQKALLIPIQENGSFEIKVPLVYPQNIYLSICNYHNQLYLEPGKDMTVFINLKYPNREVQANAIALPQSAYMGSLWKENEDIDNTYKFSYIDGQALRNKIKDMSALEFKEFCLDAMRAKQAQFKEYMTNHPVCLKAQKMREMDIVIHTWSEILSFEMYKEDQMTGNNDRATTVYREKYTPDYFSFIKPELLNNPQAVVCQFFELVINRVKMARCIQPDFIETHHAIADSLLADQSVPDNVRTLLEKIKRCQNEEALTNTLSADSALWSSFTNNTFRDKIQSISGNYYNQTRDKNYAKFFGLTNGFAMDLFRAQEYCNRMDAYFIGLNENSLSELEANLSTPFIKEHVRFLTKEKKAEISRMKESNKSKTEYTINKIPQVNPDKVFDTIIQKYKGKTIFIDFWATWCSPCRAGIKKMKPMKEELKDKNVVFVYITDESSPLDTWNLLIPDIKGEHYRLTKDEWNCLKAKFNITGIPHYTLVDKKGDVLKDGIYFNSEINEFKKMIEDALN